MYSLPTVEVRMGGKGYTVEVLGGKSEWKIPLCREQGGSVSVDWKHSTRNTDQ